MTPKRNMDDLGKPETDDNDGWVNLVEKKIAAKREENRSFWKGAKAEEDLPPLPPEPEVIPPKPEKRGRGRPKSIQGEQVIEPQIAKHNPYHDEPEDVDLLEKQLSIDVETENQVKSVSKELFNRKSIDLKTDVSHDEINNLTRLRFLAERFNVKNVDLLTESFLSLRVSKNRASRREFIEALQSERREKQQGGFFSKLFGGKDNDG